MAVPVVGVVSSAILLGEEITVALSIGLMLVVMGVAINLLYDKNKEEVGPPVVEGGLG
jgi:drug/metabolite transporter (DMT)-like permease